MDNDKPSSTEIAHQVYDHLRAIEKLLAQLADSDDAACQTVLENLVSFLDKTQQKS